MSSWEKEIRKKLEFTSIIELGYEENKEDDMKNWLVFNIDILDF